MNAEQQVSKELIGLENAATGLQSKRLQFQENERKRDAERKSEQRELRASEELLQREKNDAVRTASRNLPSLLQTAWNESRLIALYGQSDAQMRLKQREELLKLAPSLPVVPLRALEVVSRYSSWLKDIDAVVLTLHDSMSSDRREIKMGRRVIVDGSTLFYFSLVVGGDTVMTLFLSFSSTANQVVVGAANAGLALALPLSTKLNILRNLPLNIQQSEEDLTLGTAYVLSQELMARPSAAAAVNF